MLYVYIFIYVNVIKSFFGLQCMYIRLDSICVYIQYRKKLILMLNLFKKEYVYFIYLYVCLEKIVIFYIYSIILKYIYELKVNLVIKCFRNIKYCIYLN